MLPQNELLTSWTTEEQLNELTRIKRYNELVTGIVRSIESKTRTVVVDGESQKVKEEILIVALPNGVTGYCAAKEFAIHEFKNTRKLVGRTAQFVIQDILLEDRILILNGKEAQQRNIEEFWAEVEELEKRNELDNHVFTGEITGTSPDGRVIHVRIKGQDCHIQPGEWSWNRFERPVVEEGAPVEVKIKRFDKENRRVEVSRRLTLPDPLEFLSKLEIGDSIAGRVSRVDPVHGIFVQLENGLDVKASRVKNLEEPIVGDIVNCRVTKKITREESGRIKGRVVIVGYPRGKRRRKDLGAFLFE